LQTSHIQLAGGNSLSRFLTNRLINQARIRGITYSGEIRPTAMTRTVLSDLNKLSDSGLIFQNGPLDLSMILICFQHRYQTEADSLGRGLFLGNGDQRRTILEDIVKFGQQGITDCVSAIDIELAQLNDFYSRPVLITTGGTINMAGATGRKAAGVVEKLTKERFLSSLIYGQQIKALPEQPDSSNIGPNDWKLIFDAVVRVYSQKMSAYDTLVRNGYVIGKPGGIMITHGTDTLEETACILAFELARRNIPMAVVMTGSHSPADQPNSDAESNLLRAALIANNPNTPAGVYVVIGNKVHLGARVKKVFTIPTAESNWSYFSSLGAHIGYFPENG